MEGLTARAGDAQGESERHRRAPQALSRSPFALALWVTLAVGIPIAVYCVVNLDLSVLGAEELWALGHPRHPRHHRRDPPADRQQDLRPSGVTPSTAFTFAILFTWGLVPAVVFHCAASLMSDLIERKIWWKTAFNVGQYSVSLATAWLVLLAFGWEASLTSMHMIATTDLAPMIAAWIVYFVVNNGLVSFVVGLFNGESFWGVFYEDFGYQVFTNVAVLSFSGIVALVIDAGAAWLPLVLPPMIAIYATAGLALDREHQANHDSLTELPNRKLLVDQLAAALKDRADGESVALVRARPRPVQGGQRHPRSPDRRPAAADRGPATARGRTSRGHGRPPRRRRVRRAAAAGP